MIGVGTAIVCFFLHSVTLAEKVTANGTVSLLLRTMPINTYFEIIN